MQYDLVFEGGGAKGMVFAGALKEFNRRGHTPGRLLGTSAGAITATLLAAGYTVDEIFTTLAEQNSEGKSVFNDFIAPPGPIDEVTLARGALAAFLDNIDIPIIPGFVEKPAKQAFIQLIAEKLPARHLVSFIELGGWYSADAFVAWLTRKLDSGTFKGKPRNFSGMSFTQLHAATGSELSLCATDTTARQLLVLNRQTAPNLPVVWAARMSMSIPLLWQEVVWKPEWGQYNHQDITGHIIVDGGVLSNFPIELFLSNLKTVTDVMGAKTHTNVLGMLIDEEGEVPGAPPAAPTASGIDVGGLKTVQRIGGLVNTMLEARDKSVIDTFKDLVVRLPAKGYGTIEFDMTPERRELLVAAGEKAMKVYFDKQEATSFDIVEPPTPQEIANDVASRILK